MLRIVNQSLDHAPGGSGSGSRAPVAETAPALPVAESTWRPNGKRVLLTSVIKPFGERHGDGFLTSFTGSHQILWAQDIFRMWTTANQYGLDFLAHNLLTPTVTLHYPTMKRLLRELEEGYDYVGIAFNHATIHKLIAMVGEIRRVAPQTQIVLGGYGTALSDEIIGEYGDHICRGEGVAYMRELLGEPVDRPIEQPDILEYPEAFNMRLAPTGVIVGSLGCPNGCDFCATSAYFKRRHIRFLDGDEIVDAIRDLRARHPGLTSFYISDEDFLLNPRYGRKFLEAMRAATDLPPLSLQIYGSVKALSNFTTEELVEMGIDFIWIGYEGERAGYAKLKGRSFTELMADLKAHGITVLTSMIIGFDYQTPETIREEFEALLSMRPSMCQFLIYGPAVGTPLLEKFQAEGRMISDYVKFPTTKGLGKFDGSALTFTHPTMNAEELQGLQRELYTDEYARLGPSFFRAWEDWLNGYVNLRDHKNPRIRAKAQLLRSKAHEALTLIPASRRYLAPHVVQWIEQLERRIERETGPRTLRERVETRAAVPLLAVEKLRQRLGITHQPHTSRRVYHSVEGERLNRVTSVALEELLPRASLSLSGSGC